MLAADPLGGADMVYGAAERARTSATVDKSSSSIALKNQKSKRFTAIFYRPYDIQTKIRNC